MAAPTKGTPIKLGDRSKKRTLRFDWAALVRLEEETRTAQHPDGMPLTAFLGAVQGLSVRAIETGLWVGLLHAEPDLSREDVRGMINPRRLGEIMGSLVEALGAAMPGEEADEGNGDPATT